MRSLTGGKRSASALALARLALTIALCLVLNAAFTLSLSTERASSKMAQQSGSAAAAAAAAAAASPARLSPVIEASLERRPTSEEQYIRSDSTGPNCTTTAECGRPAKPGHPTWTPCTPQPSRNCPPKKGGGGGGGGGGSGGGGGHGVLQRQRSGQTVAASMLSIDGWEEQEGEEEPGEEE